MLSEVLILVVDDSASDRLLLSRLLKNLGYGVVEAGNGEQALALFAQHQPQLVLMDALMPALDGFETTRAIKRAAGDRFVPVIFVTSLQDPESLRHCVAVGGDDFLSKPYNSVVLAAKLKAFLRMGQMHSQLQHQHEGLLRDQRMAKRIFDRVAHAGCLDLPNIQYRLAPMAVFNGDIVLAATSPSGNLTVLHGDFTGHGLAAAIGAMPLAQTFYGMVAKGFALREILTEINRKLYEILPTEVFCCACALDLDFTQQTLQYWNGGLPDGYLYRAADASLSYLPSTHLPLGVRVVGDFELQVDIVDVAPGDRIYLWSDGLLEATNAQGEAFGEHALQQVFRQSSDPAILFQRINHALAQHQGDLRQDDDLSLVEVTVVAADQFAGLASASRAGGEQRPLDWSVAYEFRADTLRDLNPLPLVLHNLLEISALRSHSGPLYTVLSELYANALEHGVLQLDSSGKRDPDGFADYYQQRKWRLAALDDAFVRIKLWCAGSEIAGRVTIEVEDSGPGFDIQGLGQTPDSGDLTYCGRGYALICQLCESVRYYPPGNRVVVTLTWQV